MKEIQLALHFYRSWQSIGDQNKFTLQSGILRYKGKIVVGSATNLQARIFESFHASPLRDHSGAKVTLHRIKQLFFWPKMKQMIHDKIAACPICQISKTERIAYPGLLDPLNIPTGKWKEISLDFVEGLPKSRGKDVILVIVDRLTKYAHFLAMSHPYTVQKVADLFMNNVVKLHGPPSVIVSDRDRVFTRKLCKEIFSNMQVSLHFSSAYHPVSDEIGRASCRERVCLYV